LPLPIDIGGGASLRVQIYRDRLASMWTAVSASISAAMIISAYRATQMFVMHSTPPRNATA
jgi:hypothetical protein